jgi:hypothetical protein
VRLHHERAREEAGGYVCYLRPAYQAPGTEQASLALPTQAAVATAATGTSSQALYASPFGNRYDNAQVEAGWSTLKTPNYCPAVVPLPRWKKPVRKSPGTSTPASTSTYGIPPTATASLTNLNRN